MPWWRRVHALHRRYNRRPMMWPHIIPSRTCANARERTHELWIQLQALTWGTGTKGHVGKAEERSAPALSSSPGRPAAISTKPELLVVPTAHPGGRNECWCQQGLGVGATAYAPSYPAGTNAAAGRGAAASASAPAAATTAAVGQAAGRATGATAAAEVVAAASATGSTRNHDIPFARPTQRRRESAC